MSRLFNSFTFRLVLLYTGLSLSSMILLLGVIHWATVGTMARQIDATIAEEIIGLEEQYQSRGLNGLTTSIEARIAHNSDSAALYLLTDLSLRPLVGNLAGWPAATADSNGWIDFSLQRHASARQARARSFLLNGDLRLLVGRNLNAVEATRHLLLDALLWGLITTVALALLVGVVMSRRVARRIEAINQTSREIMQGNLSRRIPSSGNGDDFDQLTDNLNRMLERIEALMASIRQVSDNIAHDLRTPLTRLRTRLEQIHSSHASDSSQMIEQAIADSDELLTTFNALLRIARIEADSGQIEQQPLNLADLLRDIAELYEPVAAEKRQRLSIKVTDMVPIQGDRHLLFQAFANLVDNAIKHSPPGSVINLSAAIAAQGAEIVIADNGPGIPAELHDKVFQRFYRCDTSRSTPGTGLGLSLVRAVIDLHQAQIELADNRPGLRVRMVFATLPSSSDVS